MRVLLRGLVDDIAAGIERQEGVGCQFHNNPGALRSWPGVSSSGGFANFESCDDGRQAIRDQVRLNINRHLTLQEFFGGKPGVYPGYAPAADNNSPSIYAQHLSDWYGIPVDVPLDDYEAGAYGNTGGFDDFLETENGNMGLWIAVGVVGGVVLWSLI